jgi:hypothetical protein
VSPSKLGDFYVIFIPDMALTCIGQVVSSGGGGLPGIY